MMQKNWCDVKNRSVNSAIVTKNGISKFLNTFPPKNYELSYASCDNFSLDFNSPKILGSAFVKAALHYHFKIQFSSYFLCDAEQRLNVKA